MNDDATITAVSAPQVAATSGVRAPSRRRPAMEGMACVDTSRNPRIPVLMELVGAMSRADTPQDVLSIFGQGLTKLRGQRGYISLSTRGLKPGQYRVTRMIFDGNADAMRQADPWHNLEKFQVYAEGFLGEIIRSAYPELIHHLNVQSDPVLGNALAPFACLMAIPLFDGGEPLNWAIMLHPDPEGFTVDDLEAEILQANLVGGTVRNTLIAAQLREADTRIRREIARIADIQRSLLPDRMPDIEGVRLAASYETFDQAGGDYYDFLPPSLHHAAPLHASELGECQPWGLLISDASGHGPAAAVIMAMLHSILHAYPDRTCGPAEVLRHINLHLCRKRIEGSFVTAFFGIYNPKDRRFSYARAGHNPPLLKEKGSGSAVRRLDDIGGIPLGVMEEAEYDEATIFLKPGQSLVLYTDGITEAFSPDRKMFGIEGIEQALITCTGEPECVVHSVTTALKAHENGVRPSDDQTLVVMRVDDECG